MRDELSEETQKAIDLVEKILRLAAKNPNKHEAENATIKAMAILAAHNLDMAAVERNSGDTGKRAQENLEGGAAEWQRDLWKSVAELNFCMYWHQTSFNPTVLGAHKEWRGGRAVRGIYVHKHNVVGRTVNIAGTAAMAGYLQSAIDRLTRERCIPAKITLTSKFATSYREGLTFGVTSKIYERRKELLSEEAKKVREAQERAAGSATDGVSGGTGITLASHAQTEADANTDFIYGEGTSAKRAQERVDRARLSREAEEEHTKWALEHPKEAAKEAARQKREAEKFANRRTPGYHGDASAWVAGREAAKGISIDQQAGHSGAGRKRIA